MPNQTSVHTHQNIDPIYRNLTKGQTLADRERIVLRNAHEISVLCDLIAGFDTSITNEPILHASEIIERLTHEIMLNQMGLVSLLQAHSQEV